MASTKYKHINRFKGKQLEATFTVNFLEHM